MIKKVYLKKCTMWLELFPLLFDMMHKCPPANAILAKNETKKGHNQADIVQNACLLKEHLAEMCIENKHCPSYNDSIVDCGF